MLVSEKNKFIFIHIQKTAGNSITEFLKNNIPDLKPILNKHDFAIQGKHKLGDQWDDYFKFAFVRNPWDRLVSWYSMIKDKNQKNKFGKYVTENSSNFEEFIKNCTDIIQDNDGIKSAEFNQLDYLIDENGNIIVDFIGRFENLEEDFNKIIKKLNMPELKLPILNSSKHEDYKKYYNEETKKIIEKRFKKDIDFFKYKF